MAIQLALAVFRSSSTPAAKLSRPRRIELAAGHAPRPFYPRCSATRSVASHSRLRRKLLYSGDAHGVLPFAVLFLCDGLRNVSAAHSPHAVRWASTSICFHRGIDRLIYFAAAGSGNAWGPRFTHVRTKNGRSRKSTSASGFSPRAQSVSRHHQQSGGAILPWALPLPGFRTHEPVRPGDLETSPEPSASGKPLPAPIRSWVFGQPLRKCIGQFWSPPANPCNRRPFSVFMRLTPSPSAAVSRRPGTTPCVRFCTCREDR
jgi:hypothetical protein